MALRAAVFDFDGVIVDSEPLHFRALHDALLADGVTISAEEYWGIYLAYHDRAAIRLALEHHGEPAPEERLTRVEERKVARFAELLPEVPVFDGARALVRALADELPLAIASGARHGEIEAILCSLGLRDAFAAIVGADDVPRAKPDPLPYLEAARRLGSHASALAAADCVAFEDSPPGIASALGAGMRVVAVAHSYPPDKLETAHRIVDSLAAVTIDDLRGLFTT